MPIYEYVCKSCLKAFDHLARRLGEADPACPVCGSRKVAKQFSTFSPAVPTSAAKACNVCPGSGGSCPTAGRGCGSGCG